MSKNAQIGKSVLGGIIWIFLLFSIPEMGLAQHGHDTRKGTESQSKKEEPKTAHSKKGFSQTMTVEGLKVILEMMDMGEHMNHLKKDQHDQAEHAQTHVLMVTLQDPASKEILSDAKLIFDILGPMGQKETGTLKWSGDHYAAGFSPKEKGTYQIRLKIESGGMEREAKFAHVEK